MSAQSVDSNPVDSDPRDMTADSAPANQSKPIAASACPSLFYPTAAQDGQLVRLRIPGGLLNSQQCRVLAEVSDRLGVGAIDITNRANVQIRGLARSLPEPLLLQLQAAGLAAPLSEVDHLRNIMASPTAGVDLAQLIDTRPFVWQLDEYLSSHADLAGLSPKFSIGLDGGEQISIRQQPNDIQFTAVEVRQDATVTSEITPGVYFQLSLAGIDLELEERDFAKRYFLLKPADCVTVVAALAQAYLRQVEQISEKRSLGRKPRLKQVLAAIDLEEYLVHEVGCVGVLRNPTGLSLGGNLVADSASKRVHYPHLGVHPQRNGSYIGIVSPLGRLKSDQLRHLADVSEAYSSGSLRLSPWRNLLLTDIADADLSSVQQALERLNLSPDRSSASVWGGLVACSGTTGCATSATDTQADAHALAQVLDQTVTLDQPIAIHFSGCPKSCAHHGSSDVTLVGTIIAQKDELQAGYDLYIGDRSSDNCDQEHSFGRLLAANVLPAELPQRISQMISVYQRRRSQPNQSFREFVDQYPLNQLQGWFDTSSLDAPGALASSLNGGN